MATQPFKMRSKAVVSLYVDQHAWFEFNRACRAQHTTRGQQLTDFLVQYTADWQAAQAQQAEEHVAQT